jgi:uncharacterized protein YigE (DUF2233 family)
MRTLRRAGFVSTAVVVLAITMARSSPSQAQPEITFADQIASADPQKSEIGARGTMFRWTSSQQDQKTDFIAIEVKDSSTRGNIIDVQRDGRFVDIFSQLACPDALVITNGGFYAQGEGGRKLPLGLVISDGITKSKFSDRRYGGVIVFDQKATVFRRAAYKYQKGHRQALQSSPILIFDSKNDMGKPDETKFDRTAIGVSSSGRLLVFGAFASNTQAMTLWEFTIAILSASKKQHLDVKSVLALDGGPSSHVYVPSLKLHLGNNGLNFLPNAVCL